MPVCDVGSVEAREGGYARLWLLALRGGHPHAQGTRPGLTSLRPLGSRRPNGVQLP